MVVTEGSTPFPLSQSQARNIRGVRMVCDFRIRKMDVTCRCASLIVSRAAPVQIVIRRRSIKDSMAETAHKLGNPHFLQATWLLRRINEFLLEHFSTTAPATLGV